MTSGPERYRLLASALAGRPLDVTVASAGELPYTDGAHVFVTAGREIAQQRREVLAQASLLGAGSLGPEIVRALRGRPRFARRYLALEGARVFCHSPVPSLARAALLEGLPLTSDPDDSLHRAQSRSRLPDPPDWFGQIRPGKLLGQPPGADGQPTGADLKLQVLPVELPETDDDEEHDDVPKMAKLLQNPLMQSATLANLLGKLLGTSRQPGEGAGGGGNGAASHVRRVDTVGPHARPVPIPLRMVDDPSAGPVQGIGGAVYPEWDGARNRYRPEWCRVLDVPFEGGVDVSQAGVERDEVLHRRLARVALGPLVQRRRPDGDDLDVDALIDLAVDLRSGCSPKEHVFLERRKLRRELGVLILLDASGSTTDMDGEGNSVHEHQRKAAATLVATMEELGDRVALYAFRSRGRSAVQMLGLKTFDARFGAGGRARLNELWPDGYTRMGAAIRHATEILKRDSGTPSRLLLVLSDGFPYDDGYEGRYAESDVSRALAEAREDGVACLCLSIGAAATVDGMARVFGAAAHAGAPRLSDLSGRMDELVTCALKELSSPRANRRAV